MGGMKTGGKKVDRKQVYCFLVTAMLVCTLLISAFLAYNGVRYSYYSQRDYSLLGFMKDRVWLHIVLFMAAVTGTGVFGNLIKRLAETTQEKIGTGVLLFTGVWILMVWSLYVWQNPYYPLGDQLNTTAGAYYSLQGNYSMLSPGGYIGMYQQQKGLMFFYEILFTIFGDFSYGEAKQIHVLLGILGLIAGYFFLKLHVQGVISRIIYCIFYIFCMPFMLYMPYIYGDVPSISLCMVMFWALSAFGKNGKKRYLVIAAATAGCALLLRMNTWIILIAVAIGLLLSALRQWKWKPILVALLVLLTAEGSVKAVDLAYEIRSGYESGIGIPSILWIAMGLQETDGFPGKYNRYQQAVFSEFNYEREPAAEVGREYIKGRMQEFVNNPEEMVDFFKRKLQTQWLEPLFASLYSTNSFEDNKPVPEWINDLYYGASHDTVWRIANYYQSTVYLSLFVFVAFALLRKEKEQLDSVFWIPLISVVGGFLFSMIWENQSRYVLPYFVFMLLYVPLGLEKAAFVLLNFFSRIHMSSLGYIDVMRKERGKNR